MDKLLLRFFLVWILFSLAFGLVFTFVAWVEGIIATADLTADLSFVETIGAALKEGIATLWAPSLLFGSGVLLTASSSTGPRRTPPTLAARIEQRIEQLKDTVFEEIDSEIETREEYEKRSQETTQALREEIQKENRRGFWKTTLATLLIAAAAFLLGRFLHSPCPPCP